jgi:predicted NBD/HSP70 family sugar kinase
MPTVSFVTSGALQKSALKEANERLVLDAIRRKPGISRAELARRAGLPRTSVTFVVDRLLKSRMIQEGEVVNGGRAGRPAAPLHLRGDSRLAIGVEISRSKSRVVLVDLNGTILRTEPVSWHADPKTFLSRIATAIQTLAGAFPGRRMLGAGVSLPGTIDKSRGHVIGAESLGWVGVDAGELLRSRTRLPLFFENDANLSALAEEWSRPSEGEALRYFVYVRMQGGLGTGVVVDGRVLHGSASASAEFGHVMLDPEGRPCGCGNRGCWEQYASDAALVRAFRESGGVTEADSVFEEAVSVVKLTRSGDAVALGALRRTAHYLALGFVNLIAALNPQAIILGEPFASAWELVEDVVLGELRRRLPPYSVKDLRVLPSRLGEDSALRGAATLVLAHFFTRFDHTRDHARPNLVSVESHG